MSATPSPCEKAYGVILACVNILNELDAEDCALEDGNERIIPKSTNNAFVRSGLVGAIEIAAADMLKKGGAQ